jgi:dihydroxyacid dehydratase/phosphogluconate dehydratase
LRNVPDGDREVIRAYGDPLKEAAGYVVMSGNLFDSAVMKISVIDQDFRRRFLADPAHPNVFEGKAIVSRGPRIITTASRTRSLALKNSRCWSSATVVRSAIPAARKW